MEIGASHLGLIFGTQERAGKEYFTFERAFRGSEELEKEYFILRVNFLEWRELENGSFTKGCFLGLRGGGQCDVPRKDDSWSCEIQGNFTLSSCFWGSK